MFIDKNAKRINPAAVIKHDGNTYNGNVLMFPEVVAALGITEIADPQPPQQRPARAQQRCQALARRHPRD